jgi:D-lactate dehydrogenase
LPEALDEETAERHRSLEILDSIAWAHDHLLPRLNLERLGSVAVHPTCSTRHLGMTVKLQGLAEALAADVYTPPSAYCCGFAGDRGLLHPELTASATRDEAAEVGARAFDSYVSSNRTCEVGLESGTGKPYVSIIQLLDERSRGSMFGS